MSVEKERLLSSNGGEPGELPGERVVKTSEPEEGYSSNRLFPHPFSASVVQRLDSGISFPNTSPLDSDLSGG